MEAAPSRIATRTSSASPRSASAYDSPTSSATSASTSIQNLSSILNNPLTGGATASSSSWSLWPTSSSPDPLPLSTPPELGPEVTSADFRPYLLSVSDPFSHFEDIRNHSRREIFEFSASSSSRGDALVACLREVPALFFEDGFELEDGATFRSACPAFEAEGGAAAALQERLTQHLDVVETHLVREISLRSGSFFEAQGRLQGLNGEIAGACGRIAGLREAVGGITDGVVGPAMKVRELNAARGGLVTLQQKLAVILYVAQALSALKLLVAAADCSGALDVTDDLQHLLDTDELAGLHCFRHLRDRLATSLDSVNSILSAEFVRAAIHDARAVDSMILSRAKTSPHNFINVIEEVKFDDDETSILRDRLLPLIIGLLRTARLPAVLRIYRDILITEMKAAIKSTVAELLPILLARPLEFDLVTGEQVVDADGRGLSLASKLRNLCPESFVQLLIAIYKVVQAHLTRAAEVKKVIEWTMGNLDGCYAADSVTVAVSRGSAAAAAAEENDNQIILNAPYSFPGNASKNLLFQGQTNESSSPNTSKNFRADISRENTEAVFAACDAAHGRWAKLLGVRALLHPKLRLQEFLSMYNITQDFIAATEKMGGRLGYSIRGTLQSQSKAFVDFQHESRMAKIKAVLEQETWVAVAVPDEFQAILESLSSSEAALDSFDLATNDLSLQVAGPGLPIAQQPQRMNEVTDTGSNQVKEMMSVPVARSNPELKVESTPSQNSDSSTKDHETSTSQTLVYGGVGYHMVNCGLILLKMLTEYVDLSKCLPSLSSEVVHRVAEILKLFNTKTCQLVLGAGAMQVSGLKSITSKHLALASQIISFIYAIMPEIRRVLFLKTQETRKGLLLSEFDRVAQDYRVHRDEIHTKLVQIMRERLLANLRKLPQIAESWNAPEDDDSQPSQFARHVTKEVSYLHRILSPTLHEGDVLIIFRQVVQIFHSHISEAFSKLNMNTPQGKNRVCRDVQHILGCIHKLPSDNSSKDCVPNFGLLDEFLAERLEVKEGQ
ncbi:putative vacuolar protein sorting-associated protein 54, chloroplastic [Iris pallida]|uniref:Vacuolar protein sorting-associated protein 54, chloroplastic n=1 Tax=Iris pallida TaxID=29817 RepID=A0AAX6H6Z4_IRIPA|nr:putative vacuolar protein sorting-associated protein 54, chloroplastic [Iris pallida]